MSWMDLLTSSKASWTPLGGMMFWSWTAMTLMPMSYFLRVSFMSSTPWAWIAVLSGPMTSRIVRSPTSMLMTDWEMSLMVWWRLFRLKSQALGSSIRYWMIHSTLTMFRSPVSIVDSSGYSLVE